MKLFEQAKAFLSRFWNHVTTKRYVVLTVQEHNKLLQDAKCGQTTQEVWEWYQASRINKEPKAIHVLTMYEKTARDKAFDRALELEQHEAAMNNGPVNRTFPTVITPPDGAQTINVK